MALGLGCDGQLVVIGIEVGACRVGACSAGPVMPSAAPDLRLKVAFRPGAGAPASVLGDAGPHCGSAGRTRRARQVRVSLASAGTQTSAQTRKAAARGWSASAPAWRRREPDRHGQQHLALVAVVHDRPHRQALGAPARRCRRRAIPPAGSRRSWWPRRRRRGCASRCASPGRCPGDRPHRRSSRVSPPRLRHQLGLQMLRLNRRGDGRARRRPGPVARRGASRCEEGGHGRAIGRRLRGRRGCSTRPRAP